MAHERVRSEHLAARLGRWSARNRGKAVVLWLLLTVLLAFAGAAVGQAQLNSLQLADGQSHQALELLQQAGLNLPANESVFVRSEDSAVRVGSPQYAAVLRDLDSALEGTGQIEQLDKLSAQSLPTGPISANQLSTLVRFDMTGDSATAYERVEPVLDAVASVAARHPGFQIEEFGEASFTKQANGQLNKDYGNAESITFLVSFVILLVVFGAFVAALLPLLLAATALVAATGLLALTSHALPVDVNATSVMALVGVAVGVDYSLFYIRRFRAEMAQGRSRQAAVEAAAATSGRSILVSGTAALIAVAGLLLAGDREEIATAEATMTVVVAAIIGSVTFLPAMLSMLGPRIDKGRAPQRLRGTLSRRTERFWGAVLHRVLLRPLLSVVLAGGAMIVLLLPAFSLHTVASGLGDVPASKIQVLSAYQDIEAVFPNDSTEATVVFAHPGEAPSAAPVAAALSSFTARVGEDAQLRGPVTVTQSSNGFTTELSVGLLGNGTDPQSVQSLGELRDSILPQTLGRVGGAQVAVTGTTAQSVDYSGTLSSRLPLIAGFVLLLTFLMMLAFFRAPVIAGLTLVLNLLSVGAAYGVVVALFQYGWGAHVFGFTGDGGITNWVPLFMFVILFGLSMDYHVFVVSGIREARGRGLGAAEAVRAGILRSAGVITAAAVVMIAVAFVFGLLPELPMKETGIGLATAILLDCTLIRAVLLPAALSLLGERAWVGAGRAAPAAEADAAEPAGVPEVGTSVR